MDTVRATLLPVVCATLLLVPTPTLEAQEQLRNVSPAEAACRADDYGLIWWADGFPGRDRPGRWLECIQTGRYALALDVEKMLITALGPVDAQLSYQQAVGRDNSLIDRLPAAGLKLSINVDGQEYLSTGGGPHSRHAGPRLINCGRFLQRADVTDLVFVDSKGDPLDVDARLEIIAWPDRLTLLLEAAPGSIEQSSATGRTANKWKSALMSIELQTAGQTFSDRFELPPGETWTEDTMKTVSVSLTPGTRGIPAITPDDAACKVDAAAIPDGTACPVEYDDVYGWFRVDLDNVTPQGSHNDSIERVRLTLENSGPDNRAFRLLFAKTGRGLSGRGLSPVIGLAPTLRDVEGYPTGIPIQISKNWHHQPDQEILYQGTWLNAATILHLPGRSKLELEFTLIYGHWGGVPAASHAQLCLIGWGSNQLWNQSAIGTWGESICYEPDQAQAQCAITDVRPLMVHGMKSDEPKRWTWTNNVGGGDFFRYFDTEGRRRHPTGMKTAYHRYCPNLTEVTYAGQTADGSLSHSVTVSVHRTDDVVRGLYRLRMDVNRPIRFSRLVFFQIGADTYSYTGERRMALGNEDGLLDEWHTEWGGNRYKTEPTACTGRIPWVSLHEAVSRDDSQSAAWANRGIVIRRWNARLSGRPARPWVAEHGVEARRVDTSTIDVIPPPDVNRLIPGDYVEATFEHIIVPQYAADYYGPNENLRDALAEHENTWKMIYREAVCNDQAARVSRGNMLSLRPIRIQADDDRAEFSVTGGLGYVPITVCGLSHYRRPLLEILEEGGTWTPVDQSVHGRDFWQTDFSDTSKTWEVTYTVPLDTPTDVPATRRFRFQLQPAGR